MTFCGLLPEEFESALATFFAGLPMGTDRG